nr:tetratricopeptide repeat protein [Pseudenhygromyxa sp. WMMC2535]
MGALEDLAKLPQEHPQVALLQGLALVEQNRWAEAQPWLERADKLLPGRIDVEVARARVEAQVGDPEAAQRKLEALAEEEPFAPRAWTGLGEANLAVAWTKPGDEDGQRVRRDEPDATALKEARRAFKWAVQRERMPAEAYLQLAEITERKRADDPQLVTEVVDLLAKAVAANPKLPRYAERHALYLAEIGRQVEASEKLEALLDRPGVGYQVPLSLATIALRRFEEREVSTLDEDLDRWIELAEERHAPKRDLDLVRGRALLAREKPDEALALFQGILATDETDIDARVFQIRALMDKRDRDAALVAVRAGIGALPRNETGRIFLEWAQIMSRGGKRRVAGSHAKTGWSRLSEETGVPIPILLWAADEAIYHLGRDAKPKPAASIGREITALAPTHSDAWVLRANAELRTNRGSDAKASAEKAVELDPNNPRAHDILGQLYLRFGRKADAKASFEKALELGEGTPRESDYKKNLSGL